MSSQPMEIVLAERPTGEPDSNTFKLQPISNPPTTAPAGGVLLQLVVASVDPYQRGLIRRIDIGASPTNFQAARVIKSDHATLKEGDNVISFTGDVRWQTVQQHSGKGLFRVPDTPKLPLTAWAGVLGMPGRTAYFGLLDHEVGRMQEGKVVLVSGAAGAVGSLAGQLARIKGAKRVIDTAGGAEKCKRVKEHYGFDECLDYKEHDTVDKMRAALKKAAPEGVDIFFDNTGGHVLTAAFDVFNKYARMVLCGNISGYNKDPKDNLVPNVLSDRQHDTPRSTETLTHTLTVQRGSTPHTHSHAHSALLCFLCSLLSSGLQAIYGSVNIRGFVQGDFRERFQEFYDEVPQLIADGKIKYEETVYKGIEKIPEAFAGLFRGHNTGKALVLIE